MSTTSSAPDTKYCEGDGKQLVPAVVAPSQPAPTSPASQPAAPAAPTTQKASPTSTPAPSSSPAAAATPTQEFISERTGLIAAICLLLLYGSSTASQLEKCERRLPAITSLETTVGSYVLVTFFITALPLSMWLMTMALLRLCCPRPLPPQHGKFHQTWVTHRTVAVFDSLDSAMAQKIPIQSLPPDTRVEVIAIHDNWVQHRSGWSLYMDRPLIESNNNRWLMFPIDMPTSPYKPQPSETKTNAV